MSPSQHCISGLQFGFSYLLKFEKKKFLVGFKWEIKKWKPTDCPIVSLIIKISWLLIPLIHLLKKALPVSSILGQVTFIYYHPPPLSHTHTHTHTHTHNTVMWKTFRPTKWPRGKDWIHKIPRRKKVWTNEIQRHNGTDPPDPRNLVHFVKND